MGSRNATLTEGALFKSHAFRHPISGVRTLCVFTRSSEAPERASALRALVRRAYGAQENTRQTK